MESISSVLPIVGVLLVIAGAAAFIWSYYMASLNKAQLESLRGDRDDLITRVGILEDQRTEAGRLGVLKDEKILKLEREIEVLKGIVTHDATIKDLIVAVQKHDKNVEVKYTDYMQIIGTVLQHVERLLEIQEKRGP